MDIDIAGRRNLNRSVSAAPRHRSQAGPSVLNESQTTDLQQIIALIQNAVDELNIAVSYRELEDWGITIHDGMSGGDRDYHSIEHVFDVAKGAAPVAAIAGLFHDIVYLEIDPELKARQAALLSDVFVKNKDGHRLLPFDRQLDPNRAMLEDLFGISPLPGTYTTDGMNEFLSAMVATRSLQDVFPPTLIAQIGACIEATIPFRPVDGSGRSPCERLLARLHKANLDYKLNLAEHDLEATVHHAVSLANRDVAGFALEDTALFLDYTWKLLPESNHALRSRGTYTLSDYRIGLIKMGRFFAFLEPELVFCQFHYEPADAEIRQKIGNARINIQRGKRYLQTKAAALSVLYSLAVLTGGDAPVALFVGDIRSPEKSGARMEDYLPHPGKLQADTDKDVFELLSAGRRSDSRFDIKESPLAAYLYARLGDSGITKITRIASDKMSSKEASDVLSTLPTEVVNEIIRACMVVATTRAHLLGQLLR